MHVSVRFLLPATFLASLATTAPAAAQTAAEVREQRVHNDWAWLERFRADNAALSPPPPGEDRVVFMGNSITEQWAPLFAKQFPGKPYIGRGISGQTTPQMLVRFRQDVIALQPKVVVILAGTNDIAGNTGPSTVEMIEDNIASMTQLAQANGIRVVLCAVLPVYDYPWKRGLEPAGKIVALNQWLKAYAARVGAAWVDFHSPMADARQGLKAELSGDGVHPNEAGYRIMAPLVERGIAQALGRTGGLSVRSDPRIELLAIVFRLAGAPEYSQGMVPSFTKSMDEYFAPYREHPAVLEARRLREQYGVSYDAVMSMAFHIDGVTSPKLRRPVTDNDPSLERRWKPAEAEAFVRQLAAFSRDTRFDAFLAANRPALDSARARMQRVVDANIDVPALTAFFGREPNGSFVMTPLLTNGPGNFGPRYLDGDREEVYAVIGTRAGPDGWPAFDAGFTSTMVHEFSHSFVNPAVNARQDLFRSAGEAIYPAVEAEMRGQAYGNWLTMINESLVRASVARYIRAKRGDVAGQQEVAAQRARGFYWTNELYELLGEYERERTRYPSFDSFLPRVAEYFKGVAPRIGTMIAAYDSLRPRFVRLEPDTVVAAGTERIVLRFDRPMGPGVNINIGPSGRDHTPEVKKFEWDASGTALTLYVALKPAWTYEMVLGSGFRSRSDGVALRPTTVRLSTR